MRPNRLVMASVLYCAAEMNHEEVLGMNQPIMLTQKDLTEIDAFHRLCFSGDHFGQAVWEDLLSDPKTLVYAMRQEKGLAALLAIYNWQDEDDYVKIMTLSVHPGSRRKGYATVLMDRMHRDMQGLGMHTFKAETWVSNQPMQALFEKQGYKRTLRVDNMMAHPAEDGFKYQRRL